MLVCLSFKPNDDMQFLKKYIDHSAKKMSKDTLYFKVTHLFYENGKTQPKESISGFFVRAGLNYYSYAAGILSIQNKNLLIMVDSSEKSIFVNNPQVLGLDPNFYNKPNNFNDYNVLRVPGANGNVVYNLSPKSKNNMVKLSLTFNADTILTKYRAENIFDKKLVGSDKNALEIIFADFNFKPKISGNSYFSTDKYVYQKDKKIYPSARYKNYQITDLRIKFE